MEMSFDSMEAIQEELDKRTAEYVSGQHDDDDH